MNGQNLLQIFGNGKVTQPDHIGGALYQPGISKVNRLQTINFTQGIFMGSDLHAGLLASGGLPQYWLSDTRVFFNSTAFDPNFTLGHT